MPTKPHLLTTTMIDAATKGILNDGGAVESCALEILTRNNGRSKRGYFRYPGTRFGERRTMRIPLGRYDDIGLIQLRRMRAALEQLFLDGKSPARHQKQLAEQRRAAGMTLGTAVDEFFQFAGEPPPGQQGDLGRIWSPNVRKNNERIRRKHLDGMDIMNSPIEGIRAIHIDEAFGEKWRSTVGIGPRIRSLLHSSFQYQIDKDDGVYRGPNPVSWRKTSSLSKRWGPQLASTPCAGVHHEDIPKVVAYFCQPMDHWVPGYLTTMQAAWAFDLDPKAIRNSTAAGHFKGVIQAPPIWKAHGNLIPISELKKKYGKFVREPVPLETESARLHSRLMRFLIYTPSRADMACGLRWRNIKWNKGYIEYLPKRRDPWTGLWLPSEHKLGWKYLSYHYLVMLTDNLRGLIEMQRDQQIGEGVKIEPDGFVFIHGKTRTGTSWGGKRSSHRTLDDYLRDAVNRLKAKGETIRIIPEHKTKATVHGFRARFTKWATEQGYGDDLINLSLGHVIPAIRDNKTNWHYFYDVERLEARTEMMQHWERHCLSLVEPADNILTFPASA